MKKLLAFCIMVLSGVLTACNGQTEAVATTIAGTQPFAGFEIYDQNGGVNRPSNAIDVYIVYSPESQDFMPEIIRLFNQSYADGKNPMTGQPLAQGELPIYVWGTDPVSGSSGTVAQGIFNAILAPTNANVYKPTIFMPSTSNWLGWVNSNANKEVFDITAAQPTSLSPVIIGIWEDRLKQLEKLTGKSRTDIGWEDILTVLQDGWKEGRRAVYYGHTDPRQSSTGLSATIEEFYACARSNGFTARRLTLDQINNTQNQACMRQIQSLVKHYSRRTEDFLSYFGQGPDYLDMLALEEVDLICINRGAVQGSEQCLKPQGGNLVALYPADGTFWHERAAAIVQLDVAQGGWTTAPQREAAKTFIDYILTPESQNYIMTFGYRPANPSLKASYPIDAQFGVLPDVPSPTLDNPDITVINAIQQSWSVVKKQADVMLLIDVSGSMNDEDKIGQAKTAAKTFLDTLETTNNVGLTIFSDGVKILVPMGLLETNKDRLLRAIDNISADGGTELYQALTVTVDEVSKQDADERVRAVILLSDGQDTGTQGYTLNNAINAISASSQSLNPVIVVPLAYGSGADVVSLNQIAQASRTSVISGTVNNIAALLSLLSSYF